MNMYGLRKGDNVIVITSDRGRELFRYETAASWEEFYAEKRGEKFERTYEPWDGIERVNFDNGD